MKRYEVTYKGKKTIVRADDAVDAIERFCNRQFFGRRRIHDWRVSQFDADTRGGIWCEGWTRGEEEVRRLLAILATY